MGSCSAFDCRIFGSTSTTDWAVHAVQHNKVACVFAIVSLAVEIWPSSGRQDLRQYLLRLGDSLINGQVQGRVYAPTWATVNGQRATTIVGATSNRSAGRCRSDVDCTCPLVTTLRQITCLEMHRRIGDHGMQVLTGRIICPKHLLRDVIV